MGFEFDGWLFDIGNADGEVDEILFGFGFVGSLGPENCGLCVSDGLEIVYVVCSR